MKIQKVKAKSVKKVQKVRAKSVPKKVLRKYWDSLQIYQETFCNMVSSIEEIMEKETGIEGIEFVRGCDGHYCGIGNIDRSMKLVQFE